MAEETQATAPPVAGELVHQFFVLLKAAGVYDRGNEGFLRHSASAREVLSRALEEQGGARLEARGDLLFFNGLRVRFHTDGSAGARFLIGEMAKRGIGVIEFSRRCDPGQFDTFVFALRATDPRKGEGLAELRARLAEAGVDGISVLPRALSESEETAGPETGRRAAQRAFFQAVRVVEEIMARAREGREAAFAPAKRVVHALVERVVEDEQAMFELATLRGFDEYTYAHCVNVSVYSIAIGARLGLDRALLSDLGFSGLFHDLGKSRLPLALVDKPDELADAEWVQMRRHPSLGAKALLATRRSFDRGLARAVATAFEHHRGADGCGYPALRRSRRPRLFARVCAIADAFDALTSGRVYQKTPMGPAEALRRMVQRAGTGYDTFLLRLFVNAVGVFPIGTPLLLDDGRVGIVWRNDASDLLRPKVRIVAGTPTPGGVEVVDLARLDSKTGLPLRSPVRIADAGALGIDASAWLTGLDLAEGGRPAAPRVEDSRSPA